LDTPTAWVTILKSGYARGDGGEPHLLFFGLAQKREDGFELSPKSWTARKTTQQVKISA
jgi:hypothetical protein